MAHHDDEDEHALRCACDDGYGGQALAGVHDALEVVHVDGRDVIRRHAIMPCPTHVAAILRARAYSPIEVMAVPRRDRCA